MATISRFCLMFWMFSWLELCAGDIPPKYCQEEWSAKSFLSSQIGGFCCYESYCEENKATCSADEFREFIREKYCGGCPNGSVSTIYFYIRCWFICLGCKDDVDDCASHPCATGATCVDLIGGFRCECPKGYYGVLCNSNVCHPTPADVVFLLDSSVSMTEKQFNKQLEFVANFTDQVFIGPDDFQISVITFSFDAHVEFYLNNFTTNETLKAALKHISYKPGATFTHKALDKVPSIFTAENGGHRKINGTLPDRFVFLLTDGMSTYKDKTKTAAANLKPYFQIYVIGIGNEVSHEELLNIASGPSNVYSAKDFDSLYSVLKKLVQLSCEECSQRSTTDIALFVDISKTINYKYLDECKRALEYLVNSIDDNMEVRLSLSSFNTVIHSVFEYYDMSKKRDILRDMYTLQLPEKAGPKIEIVDLLTYISASAFQDVRPDSKLITIILSDGLFPNQDKGHIYQIKQDLLIKNITTIFFGIGEDVNLDRIYSIVDDAFDVYLLDPESKRNLDALKSYMTYGVCNIEND